MLDEQRQGAVEDLGWIAVGDGMPQQVLCATQLVVGLPADGELHLVAVERDRRDDRRPWRRRRRWAREDNTGWLFRVMSRGGCLPLGGVRLHGGRRIHQPRGFNGGFRVR